MPKLAKKISPVAELNLVPAAPTPIQRVGRVVDVLARQVRVDFAGNTQGPLPARRLCQVTYEELVEAARCSQEVLLTFEGEGCEHPIIVGVIASDLPLQTRNEAFEVDGRTIRLTGHDSVVLRCGEASITLDKTGKITVRGVHVVSHAAGINRIRGGSIQLN